jgi:hypothetical protein
MDVLLAAAATYLNRQWYGDGRPPAAEPVLPVSVRLLAALFLVALLLALLALAGSS